jgi:hypothetical protein
MDSSNDGQSGRPSKESHSPIFSKKRKTATHGRKKESKRIGGVSTLVHLFDRKDDSLKKDDTSKDELIASSYVISKHGEQTDLEETLPETAPPQVQPMVGTLAPDKGVVGGDDSTGEKLEGQRSGDERKRDDQEGDRKPAIKEYLAEARTYHARYDEVCA